VPATCGPKVNLLGETFKAFLGGAKHKVASDTTNIPTAKDRHFIGPPHSRTKCVRTKARGRVPTEPVAHKEDVSATTRHDMTPV
jgi:hypothetical protein